MLRIANSILSRITKVLLRPKAQENPTPQKCWEEANFSGRCSLYTIPQMVGFETTKLKTKARQTKRRALSKRLTTLR